MAKQISAVEITDAGGVWADQDMSSYVSADATAVIVVFSNTSAGSTYDVGVRKKGSSDAIDTAFFPENQFYVIVGLDTNKIFQSYMESTDIDAFVIGYLESDEVSINTNLVEVTTSTADAWTDHQANASAVAAITHLNGSPVDFRVKGSSDSFVCDVTCIPFSDHVIGCDGTGYFQYYAENTSYKFYKRGYFLKNVSMYTNRVQMTSNGGAWGDFPQLPAKSMFGVYRASNTFEARFRAYNGADEWFSTAYNCGGAGSFFPPSLGKNIQAAVQDASGTDDYIYCYGSLIDDSSSVGFFGADF